MPNGYNETDDAYDQEARRLDPANSTEEELKFSYTEQFDKKSYVIRLEITENNVTEQDAEDHGVMFASLLNDGQQIGIDIGEGDRAAFASVEEVVDDEPPEALIDLNGKPSVNRTNEVNLLRGE